MSKHVAILAAARTGALALAATSLLAVASGAGGVAQAAECLSAPDSHASPGTWWYYRVDRATNRRCWYLGAKGATSRPVALSETPQTPSEKPQTTGAAYARQAQSGKTPLTKTQREALFEDFLRWQNSNPE
jgi:hypothetical protein